MATRTRPIALTAAALASAATVVTATPDLMSSRDLSIGPSPTRLSTASYELTAISDITIAGISDAYWFGWGGYIQNSDPFYPNFPNNTGNPDGVFVSGYSGVAYYLVDEILSTFTNDFDLDNYYFEVGSQNFGIPNANYSGAGALIYVGIGETFGTDSQIFQTAQTIFYYGVTNVVNQAIVSLATLVPQIQLGPVTVGGGILAALYYYGITPDQSFQANSIGLPAIWAYISTALTGVFVPPAEAVSPAAATALAAAATSETVSDEIAPTAKSAVGEFKAEAAAADAGKTTAAEPAAEASAPAETAAPTVVEAAVAEAEVSTPAVTETAATETAATPTAATETAATETPATDAGTSTATKTATPKAQNPIGKITGKIKSALGGSDSQTGGRHRADGTGRTGKAAASTASADSSSAGSSSDSGSDK